MAKYFTLYSGVEVPVKQMNEKVFKLWTYLNTRTQSFETTIETIKREGKTFAVLPRNSQKIDKSLELLGGKDKFNIIDKRVDNPAKFKLNKEYGLLDYQENPIKEVILTLKSSQFNNVLFQAGTGFGKTMSLPYIIKQISQKTLILVDRTNLVKQMQESMEFAFNKKKVSVLNAKNKEIKDINITTLQFLFRNPALLKELQKQIGFVIVDEVHLVSVGSLTKIITSLPAKYRLGLSATPTRSDGLTQAIYDHFDNLVIGETNNLLPVQLIIVKHKKSIFYASMYDARSAWEALYGDSEFLDEIVTLTKKLLNKGRAVFIYTTSQKVQMLVKAFLNKEGISAEIINAKTKHEDRDKYINDFNERKLDVIVSGVILQKGVSIHRMDTIINISNHTKESFEQAIGRLRRQHPEKKKPVFITFCFNGKGYYKCMETEERAYMLAEKYNDKIIKWSYRKFVEFLKGGEQ
jgi:superfamily II DNA or RNA helicase